MHNWVQGVVNDHTPPLAHPSLWKYRFMPPLTQGLAVKTADLPSHTRPSCMPEHSNTGWRGPSCQSLENHAIWQKVWWSSSGQWSHWSPLQIRKFLRLLHPPIGWRSVCSGWQNPLCKTTSVAEAAGLTQGGPCQQPMALTGPLLPRRQTSPLLLLPRRRCCCSLTTSPHALHQVWGKSHNPCGGKDLESIVSHQSLLAFHQKKLRTRMHLRLWGLQ